MALAAIIAAFLFYTFSRRDDLRYNSGLSERLKFSRTLPARVAELVDALDLGSSAVRRESSSLSFRTNLLKHVYSECLC